MAGAEPREKQLWRLLAFIGRYGHQSIPSMLDRFTLNDLRSLAKAVGELIEQERDSIDLHTD